MKSRFGRSKADSKINYWIGAYIFNHEETFVENNHLKGLSTAVYAWYRERWWNLFWNRNWSLLNENLLPKCVMPTKYIWLQISNRRWLFNETEFRSWSYVIRIKMCFMFGMKNEFWKWWKKMSIELDQYTWNMSTGGNRPGTMAKTWLDDFEPMKPTWRFIRKVRKFSY